jgi:hypothetical protein
MTLDSGELRRRVTMNLYVMSPNGMLPTLDQGFHPSHLPKKWEREREVLTNLGNASPRRGTTPAVAVVASIDRRKARFSPV